MSLIPGNYTILSTARSAFIGSRLLEPKEPDLYPAELLPPIGVTPPRWTLSPGTTKEKFTMRFQNEFSAISKDGLIWVAKDPSVRPTEFTFRNAARYGPTVFLITAPDGGDTGHWAAPAANASSTQVYSEKRVIYLPVEPPIFPNHVQFQLDRLD